MPAELEYKPCPFCGSTDIDYDNDTGRDDEGFWEWIECKGCGAKCSDAKTWNRRAGIVDKIANGPTTASHEICPICKGAGWTPRTITTLFSDRDPLENEVKQYCDVCRGLGKLQHKAYIFPRDTDEYIAAIEKAHKDAAKSKLKF